MKDLFVPYELAVKLKEVGFKVPCLAYCRIINGEETELEMNPTSGSLYDWNTSHDILISAPLWQQVIDWIREENKIVVEIHQLHNSKYELIYTWHVYSDSLILTQKIDSADKLYYRCLQSGIEKAIELIQKN
jgi:hypothetical protein